jgi:orotate phosphoribosyltransferase-like protein
VFKVRVGQLKELQDDDTKAFDIARDLNISFNTAMQMVKKGYGKL